MTAPLWILTPHGVEQVEAVVQYDGTNAREVAVAVFRYTAPNPHAPIESVRSQLDRTGIKPGDWAVIHRDYRLSVHDTDPRIQVEWEPGGFLDIPKRRRPTWSFTINDRPYTLTGDWEEVE